jgi:DNA polymerase III epsilon subunit-like protein
MIYNFLIIDDETSGLDPKKSGLLSLGAVDFLSGQEFYGECRLDPDDYIDDFSLSINGFTREQCLDPKKQTKADLYLSFMEWKVKNALPNLLGGQQVGSFDIPFIQEIHRNLPLAASFMWPFGYRAVDLHSLAYQKFGKSMSLDEILMACGLEPEAKLHNALNGARLEKLAFEKILPQTEGWKS